MKQVTLRTYLVRAPKRAIDPIVVNIADDENIVWVEPRVTEAQPFVIIYTATEEEVSDPE